jgi:uncharacterized membrane protein (DUF373 family)
VRQNVEGYISRVLDWIFAAIILLLVVGIGIGLIKLVINIFHLATQISANTSYKNVIIDVFTLLILVELTRSFFDYFQSHRISLTLILDTAMVFVIRDVMVFLYTKETDTSFLLTLCGLLLVLGILRICFIWLRQREGLLLDKSGTRPKSQVDRSGAM